MMFELAQRAYGFEGSTAAKVFIVGFTLVVLFAVLFVRLTPLCWLLVGVLSANAIGPAVVYDRSAYVPQFILPLQVLRAEIHLGVSILIVLVLMSTGRLSLNKMSWQTWFILFIQMLAGVLQMAHEGPEKAVPTLLFAMVTIPASAITAHYIVQSAEGAFTLVRAMLLVAAVWTGVASTQFMLDASHLINVNGRFFGLLANPQMAGLFIAPTMVMAVWMLMHDTEKRKRILWLGILAIYALFLIWTGSRTCFLMTTIGMLIVIGSRPGKVLLVAPLAIALIAGLSILATDLQIDRNLDRLTSTDDSRSHGYLMLLEQIADSPWWGSGKDELVASENSFLAGFATYGILMAGLIMVYTFAGLFYCAKLWVQRREMGSRRRAVAELVIAFNAMYFVGSNLEGFILGRSSTMQTMMMFFGAMGMWIASGQAEDDELPELPYSDAPEDVYSYAQNDPAHEEHHERAMTRVQAE